MGDCVIWNGIGLQIKFWDFLIKFNPNENSVPSQWLRLVPEILNFFGNVISVTVGSLNYDSGLHKWSTESHSLCPVLNSKTLTIPTGLHECKIVWMLGVLYVLIYMDIKPRLWVLHYLHSKIPVKFLIIQNKTMDAQTKPEWFDILWEYSASGISICTREPSSGRKRYSILYG